MLSVRVEQRTCWCYFYKGQRYIHYFNNWTISHVINTILELFYIFFWQYPVLLYCMPIWTLQNHSGAGKTEKPCGEIRGNSWLTCTTRAWRGWPEKADEPPATRFWFWDKDTPRSEPTKPKTHFLLWQYLNKRSCSCRIWRKTMNQQGMWKHRSSVMCCAQYLFVFMTGTQLLTCTLKCLPGLWWYFQRLLQMIAGYCCCRLSDML